MLSANCFVLENLIGDFLIMSGPFQKYMLVLSYERGFVFLGG